MEIGADSIPPCRKFAHTASRGCVDAAPRVVYTFLGRFQPNAFSSPVAQRQSIRLLRTHMNVDSAPFNHQNGCREPASWTQVGLEPNSLCAHSMIANTLPDSQPSFANFSKSRANPNWLHRCPGLVIFDRCRAEIACVEVLDRPDIQEKLDAVFPRITDEALEPVNLYLRRQRLLISASSQSAA